MITFQISLETIDAYAFETQGKPKLKEAIDNRVEKHMKIAASKFLAAALRQIPTFNPPAGGTPSQVSTGFVAGAFQNLADALGSLIPEQGFPGLNLFKELTKQNRRALVKALTKHTVLQKLEKIKEARRVGLVVGKITREQRKSLIKGTRRKIIRELRESGPLAYERALNALYEEGKYHPEPTTRQGKDERRAIRDLPKQGRRIIHQRGGRTISIKVSPYYYGVTPRLLKSPQAARDPRFSTQSNKIFQRVQSGAVTIFTFNYFVDITYFSLQDVASGRSPSAPWQAMQKGREAFDAYIRKLKSDDLIPSIEAFLIRKVYKVDYKGNISIERKEYTKIGGKTGSGEFELTGEEE